MRAIGGNLWQLGHKMVEIPRHTRDTEFYKQIDPPHNLADLSKIRGGNLWQLGLNKLGLR